MALALKHLSKDDHQNAAELLIQAQDNLRAVSHIVSRASFTDRTLRAMKIVQESLIDPLREAAFEHQKEPAAPGYPSVGYSAGR